MTTDYRAMCAELTTALEAVDNLANLALHHYAWDGRRPKVVQELIDRARALLAQPVAEGGEGASDEELDELYVYIDARHVSSWRHYARAVLAKWGRQ